VEGNAINKNIAVIGSGIMGGGIAQVAAQAGFNVALYDLVEENVEVGINNIKKSLQRELEKRQITERQMKTTIERQTSNIAG